MHVGFSPAEYLYLTPGRMYFQIIAGDVVAQQLMHSDCPIVFAYFISFHNLNLVVLICYLPKQRLFY